MRSLVHFEECAELHPGKCLPLYHGRELHCLLLSSLDIDRLLSGEGTTVRHYEKTFRLRPPRGGVVEQTGESPPAELLLLVWMGFVVGVLLGLKVNSLR